ncbi:FAS1 domain-containing protein, partial [Mycena vulgaris]
RDAHLQQLIRSTLEYHIIPSPLDVFSIENTTYPTLLTLPNTEQPLRIRVAQLSRLPVTTLNMFTKIVSPNIKAANGLIHVVGHSLARPNSILDSLCNAPSMFSTLSAALRHTSVSNSINGNYTATLFAPTNRAFDDLPEGLRDFLFSPEGTSALEKLLRFHVVPDLAIHSGKALASALDITSAPAHGAHRPPPVSTLNFTLPTGLYGHSLHIHIAKFGAPSHHSHFKFFVEGRPVRGADFVASNGAIHVIDRILDPRGPRPPQPADDANAGWEDWKDWLPQWAAQA